MYVHAYKDTFRRYVSMYKNIVRHAPKFSQLTLSGFTFFSNLQLIAMKNGYNFTPCRM